MSRRGPSTLLPLAFLVLALAGCGEDDNPGGPEGTDSTILLDFEDGSLDGWVTWTQDSTGALVPGGFDLEVAGGEYRSGGSYGLRLTRTTESDEGILEHSIPLPIGSCRVSLNIRPLIHADSVTCVRVGLSSVSAGSPCCGGVIFRSDGTLQGFNESEAFRPGEWCKVEFYLDRGTSEFAYRVSGDALDRPMQGEGTACFSNSAFLQIAAIQQGSTEIAIDDVLSRPFTLRESWRTWTIEDYEYLQGKFFFLIDPNGWPIVDRLSSVNVYVDDRNGLNNLEQQAVPGYATLTGEYDGVLSSMRAMGNWELLDPNDDYSIQHNLYAGYPILILSDGRTMDGSMVEALAVSYQYTENGTLRTVGGSRGSQPDSLVLKLIRPAEGMGGSNPLDLSQGSFAATRVLELRNLYDLGNRLDPDRLAVVIRHKGSHGGVTDPDVKGPFTYLQILGLDLYTESGDTQVPGPDARVDAGRLDYDSGYLIFRELHPFALTPEDMRWFGEARPDTLWEEDARVPELYMRSDWSQGPDPNLVSKYWIDVSVRSRDWPDLVAD